MGEIKQFPDVAKWIWLSATLYPALQKTPVSFYESRQAYSYSAVLFRQSFTCTTTDGLYALIAGDCRFRLWIDGEYWLDGPPETGGDYNCQMVLPWAFFVQRQLPCGLSAGTHTILAEVTTWNDLQSDYSMGHGGFRFALFKGNKMLLASDENWECVPDEACPNPLRTSWHFDLNKRRWSRAEEVPAEYTCRRELLLYPLPPPAENSVAPVKVIAPFEPERLQNVSGFLSGHSPLVIKKGTPFTFYLEFPGEFTAQMEMTFRTQAGLILQLEPQEILGRGPIETKCREMLYALPCQKTYRSRYLRAVHYVRVTIDFAVCGWPGYSDFELLSFVIHARHFPLDTCCEFHCSDRRWEDVRNCCINTLKLCMQQMHWDSPVHQEGLGCIGDYRFEALQSYCLFGEYRLARLDLLRIARMLNLTGGRLFHIGFALFYLPMLKEYVLYSGDRSILKEKIITEAGKAVLDFIGSMRGQEGVISEAPNYMFIDWTLYKGMTMHHPSASAGMAVMTAFYAIALNAAGELAGYMGNSDEQQHYRAEYEKIKGIFNKLFYDEKNKRYINGIPNMTHVKPSNWLPADPEEIIVTPHSGIAAVAAGLADEGQKAEILPWAISKAVNQEILPYFCNFLFEALNNDVKCSEELPKLMNLWHQLYLVHPEGLRESWADGDFSHAWSGAPAIWLTRSILGITPAEPGCVRCRIAPHPCGLEFAQGEMRTPFGIIQVDWHRAGEYGYDLTVTHPAEVECEIDTRFFKAPCRISCMTVDTKK